MQKDVESNPPDDWEDCGQCGGCHPPGFTGDCREDVNRWPSQKCIERLNTRRYCGMCDKWVPARQTVCKACGMPTERAAKS